MKLYVEKVTGTYADTLKAIGLADLLAEVTNQDVRIRNLGATFEIEGADPAPVETWPAITPGYPYILDSRDKDVPAGWVLDYEREKEKAKTYREFAQKNRNKENVNAALMEQGINAPEPPDREFKMAKFMASMRKGWSSDKQLFRWIIDNQGFAKEHVLELLGLKQCSEKFPEISNSQVFNPVSGKGVHRPKPDSTSPSAISKAVINGKDEWLKFRGAYNVMLPYWVDGDFKVFVVEPGDISLNSLKKLRDRLLNLSLYGSIRLDINAALRLLETMILYSDVIGRTGIELFGRRPSTVVQGMYQAYFQSLGTAAALMNYAFMPLPSWFTVNDRDAAKVYLEIVKEHAGDKLHDGEAGCLQVLREDNSGDISILQAYRKWVLTGRIDSFLDFLSRFAVKAMEQRGRKEWIREFSVKGLDELFERGYGFVQEIINNEGFRNVARAIRNSTIYALSLNNRQVCFGLAQEWKQKIKGGDNEFVAALGEFVQQYNWESEKMKAHTVRQDDLDSVVRLVEKHKAELVGMLLLAYGYARAQKIESSLEKGEISVEA